jgi:serine/threonine protein kinase/Tol biopolymer transport system component
MTELIGQVLGDRYRIEAFLGHGGMADVYKVRDLQRAAFLAMKILHTDLAKDQAFLQHFVQEAHTLERLQHPNIVRFYGLEKADNLAFILMDFIDGITLRREIHLFKNSLRPLRILEVMQSVCAALYYAHQMGMLHCDIKPGNIITHRNGTVFLTDFGIARATGTGSLSLAGTGTPAYMAPEQFEGKPPSQASDIYSLGVVTFEMLTAGQRPFSGDSARTNGDTAHRVIWEKQHLQAPSPRMFNPEITPEMEAVVMCCLQRDPRLRFRTALDLLHALETAMRGAQPHDDDAQTRVDLEKKSSGTGRLSRSRQVARVSEKKEAQASATSAKEQASANNSPSFDNTPPSDRNPRDDREHPATEKLNSADKKSSSEADKLLPAQQALPTAREKSGKKPDTPLSGANQPPGKKAHTPDIAQAQESPQVAAQTAMRRATTSTQADKGTTTGKRTEKVMARPQPVIDSQKLAPGDEQPPNSSRPARQGETKKPTTSDLSKSGEVVPIEDAAKSKAGRTKPAAPASSSQVAKLTSDITPKASQTSAGWRQKLNLWLLIGAGALALTLIAMAIFSGPEHAPTSTLTPTLVQAPSLTPVKTATYPLVPSATSLEAIETTLPVIEAQPTETIQPTPTQVGGGQWIAFASDRSGTVQVWIMDASDPETRQQMTEAQGGACQPAWSPDGTQIAFTSPCNGPSVYYPGATIKIVRLADKTVVDLPAKTPGVAGIFDPAWSPDGETLLYTAILGENSQIWSIGLKDHKIRVLADRGIKNAQPAWSRDGKYIAFISTDDRNRDALWYMQSNGQSQELLASSGKFSKPVWLPNGMHILVSMNRGDNIPILALVDRSNPNQDAVLLLSKAYRMSHASVSPDGQWVIFWTEPTANNPEIMLASMDGKQIRQLTNNRLRDFQPAWGPK